MPKDNGAGSAKIRFRLQATRHLPDTALVLDVFAGEGLMWRRCWQRFHGATLDVMAAKVRRAAKERQAWACYRGDALRALRAGWMGHVPWDVIDLDCYGSPWRFVRAWMLSPRARAERTVVILTDGYSQRPIAIDRAIFGAGYNGQVTTEAIREVLSRRLPEWGEAQNLAARVTRTARCRSMLLHQLEVVSR